MKKNWIREASMKRLNMLVRNETNYSIDGFVGNKLPLDDVEKSGLNPKEINLIEKWIDGKLSGRQCLLALLECRLDEDSDDKNVKIFTLGAMRRPLEFEMLSSSLYLPEDFLCDSGYLYESIFSKPPSIIMKEALNLLSSKIVDQSLSSLRVDQVNLAIKQLRIESMHTSIVHDVQDYTAGIGENNIINNTDNDNAMNNKENKEMSKLYAYRLSVLIEVIRYHIKISKGKTQFQHQNSLLLSPSSYMSASHATSSSSSSSSIFPTLMNKSSKNQMKRSMNKESSSSSTYMADMTGMNNTNTTIDIRVINQHLEYDLKQAIEESKQLSIDDLESWNNVLKPYVRQLSSLKAILTTQLKEFHEKKAYISLGITADATDSTIKKAYRNKAIQLHPDKPGGDTAKFQELQMYYQEIMNKKKTQAFQETVSLDPQSQEESLHAHDILNQLASYLDIMKQAADETTNLGQLSIKYQKNIQKIASKKFPEGVKGLMQVLSNNDKNDTSVDMNIQDVHICNDEEEGIDDECKPKAKKLSSRMTQMKDGDEMTMLDADIENRDILNNREEDGSKSSSRRSSSEESDILFTGTSTGRVGSIKKTRKDSKKESMKESVKLPNIHDVNNNDNDSNSNGNCSSSSSSSNKHLTTAAGASSKKKKDSTTTTTTITTTTITDSITSINLATCSPLLAVHHVERVSETMQLIASLVMKLPSCGFRYGLATAVNTKFMKTVEGSMSIGLTAMKVIASLMTANDQVSMCYSKLQDAGQQGLENKDIHDILIDMLTTAFNSSTMTLQVAADKCVDAAISAAEIYDIAKTIILSAEEEAMNDAKKSAINKEKESDLCEEDRILLAERMKQQQQQSQGNTDDSSSNDKKDGDEEGKKKKNNKVDEDDMDGLFNEDDIMKNDSVTALKDKIKLLQLQLRIQHIQALQSLNSETRNMQKQLQQQVVSIVHDSILYDNTSSSSNNNNNNKELTTSETVSSSTTTTTTTINNDSNKNVPVSSSKAGITNKEGGGGGGGGMQGPNAVKNSLFTLLADFIDSSCNTYREDLEVYIPTLTTQNRDSTTSATTTTAAGIGKMITNGEGTNDDNMKKGIKKTLQHSFEWMMVLNTKEIQITEKEQSMKDSSIDTTTCTSTDDGMNTTGNNENTMNMRSSCSDDGGGENQGNSNGTDQDTLKEVHDKSDIDPYTDNIKATTTSDKNNNSNSGKMREAVERSNSLHDIDDTTTEEKEEYHDEADDVTPEIPPLNEKEKEKETENTNSNIPSSKTENDTATAAAAVIQQRQQLALLPDYRSKILWMCTLVDPTIIHDVIQYELKTRLDDITTRIITTYEDLLSTANTTNTDTEDIYKERMKHITLLIQEEIIQLCTWIVEGTDRIVKELDTNAPVTIVMDSN